MGIIFVLEWKTGWELRLFGGSYSQYELNYILWHFVSFFLEKFTHFNLTSTCLDGRDDDDCVDDDQVEANVDPSFTCLVWQKLEQQVRDQEDEIVCRGMDCES